MTFILEMLGQILTNYFMNLDLLERERGVLFRLAIRMKIMQPSVFLIYDHKTQLYTWAIIKFLLGMDGANIIFSVCMVGRGEFNLKKIIIIWQVDFLSFQIYK